MSLVKVWTDIGAKKHVQLLAKIIEKDGVILVIKYLTEGKDRIWRYEDDTYEIDDSSIAEYLNTDDECNIGFIPMGDGGFVKDEHSDEDYEPSDEEEEEEDEEEEDEDDEDPDEDENEEENFEDEEDEDEEDNYVEEY